MADEPVVLCSALCFLKHKFVRNNAKTLKMALMDYYDTEVLSGAKVRLVSDISELNSSVKIPHVPHRRDGENRLAREVDDLISLFTVLDENKLINCLPRYVADGPDSMPPIRLYEGELNGVMLLIKKLSDKVDEYASALTEVTRELRSLQAKYTLPPMVPSTSTQGGQVLSDCVQPPPLCESAVSQARHGDQAMTVNSWAVIASTPNRYAALAVDTDDPETQLFETAMPRRKKRARNYTNTNDATTVTHSQQKSAQPLQRPRAKIIAGKSSKAGFAIAAANKIRKKAVFCVDNLSTTCTKDDIEEFVSACLSVHVISCFETKPRRRRGQETPTDRRAFRLCIYDDDRDRLLDSASWPDSVLLSEWFFKGRDNETKRNPAGDKMPATTAVTCTTSSTRSNTQQPPKPASVVARIHIENEDTILVTNTSDCDGGRRPTDDGMVMTDDETVLANCSVAQ